MNSGKGRMTPDLVYYIFQRSGIMLVVSRKKSEKILIGDSIVITIVRIGPHLVRIGIEAPNDMAIVREELIPQDSRPDEHRA